MKGNQEYPVEKIVGEPLQIIDGRKKEVNGNYMLNSNNH